MTMNMYDARFAIVEGDEVFGSDGEKVGSIVAIQSNYVVVEKGWFFPTDYYVPMSAIASYDDGKAYLNVTKDMALNQGWDMQPALVDDTMATSATGVDTGRLTDTGAAADAAIAADREMATGTRAESANRDAPVYEEDLPATTRGREAGAARVEKDAVKADRAHPMTEGAVVNDREITP